MGAIAWVMMSLAIWHFTIFLPDRFWGGIVGAFLGAFVGCIVFGVVLHGFSIPGREETDVVTALEGIPGGALGMAVVWWVGVRQERRQAEADAAMRAAA
jgi:hypothetical protein